MIHFTTAELLELPRRYRANLINCLAGFKSVNLIGTQNETGQTNLAIFNSVVHIGANPPLMGFILRPTTVARHTYQNIQSTGHYTINSVSKAMMAQAHQTSAKYEVGQSEFEHCGFSSKYLEGFSAPFVTESAVQIGLQFEEEHYIKANDTRLVIGRIQHLRLPSGHIAESGHLDLEQLDSIAMTALDTYFTPTFLARMAYAQPDQPPQQIK